MNRHSRREFGYFDRKYGLRGLLLPLLGLLGGLLMAAVCGLVYVLAGLNPISVWALLLPAALAFLVGLFQDRLFGIR